MNSTCATTTNGLAADASLPLKTPPPPNRPGRAGVGGGDDEERLARVGLSRVVEPGDLAALKAFDGLDVLEIWELLQQKAPGVERWSTRLAEAEPERDLERAAAAGKEPHTFRDPRRKLGQKDYLSLLLFGLFNPVVDSMRGLCAASRLQRVQQEICSAEVSLGSFSEAQAVVDPAAARPPRW